MSLSASSKKRLKTWLWLTAPKRQIHGCRRKETFAPLENQPHSRRRAIISCSQKLALFRTYSSFTSTKRKLSHLLKLARSQLDSGSKFSHRSKNQPPSRLAQSSSVSLQKRLVKMSIEAFGSAIAMLKCCYTRTISLYPRANRNHEDRKMPCRLVLLDFILIILKKSRNEPVVILAMVRSCSSSMTLGRAYVSSERLDKRSTPMHQAIPVHVGSMQSPRDLKHWLKVNGERYIPNQVLGLVVGGAYGPSIAWVRTHHTPLFCCRIPSLCHVCRTRQHPCPGQVKLLPLCHAHRT
ncbi:hypothetical protein VNO77_19048 [Canavalia gladiata]|uniref:Uncharacterized protein n=1 Tax=Canavalia gladiata TaxID=3824 RepID=A0AAN9LRV1_CANGL